MIWECLKSSSPVARKDHKCCACGKVIPKGTLYNYRFGTDNGDTLAMHIHVECDNFASNYFDYDWDLESYDFRIELEKHLKQSEMRRIVQDEDRVDRLTRRS